MGEKQKYIVKKVAYEGLFNYRELFRIIDVWLREKFFDKNERRNEQYHTEEGMQIEIEFVPWKKTTDYFKEIIKIEIDAINLKEVEVENNGQKIKMHQGKIYIKLTGYLIVDYDYLGKQSWKKPLHYFLRDIFDKFVYWNITKKYRDMVIDDVNDLQNGIRSYLNLNPYKS